MKRGDAQNGTPLGVYDAESRACSIVASGTTPAALLEVIDAAITALDAGEFDVARARLRVLIAAIGHTAGSRPNLSEGERQLVAAR